MKNAGLTCIEWGSEIHASCNDIPCLKQIAKLRAEYEICCCSYGTYFRLGETPLTELEAYIHTAKQLNTNILRFWCGRKSSKDMSEDKYTRLVCTICYFTGVLFHIDELMQVAASIYAYD